MVWKDIRGYDGIYQVSEYGDVRKMHMRFIQNEKVSIQKKILSPYTDNWGYKNVYLYKDGNARCMKVQRLVADAFLGSTDGFQVNHIDGNKQNNSVRNLEICTGSENMHHAYETGLHSGGHAVCVVELGMEFPTIDSAARFVGGKHSGIYRCLAGRNKTHRGYHFLRIKEATQ